MQNCKRCSKKIIALRARNLLTKHSLSVIFAVLMVFLFISQPAHTVSSAIEPYTIPVVLKPDKQAILSSLMDGYIEELPVKEGDTVEKDQLLVGFNCNIYQAEYDKAVAQLEEADTAHQANIRLQKLGAISDPEFNQSKFELAQAVADLAIKKEVVDFCSIKAPFSGTIVKIYVKQYQTISKNIEILELLDNSELRIELIAPSTWLSWLKVGDKFSIDIVEINKTYSASITHILPKIDAISQTVRIIGKIDNNGGGLIAGMNGKAYFRR